VAVRFLKDDGDPISPQYFNDLERDRRNPSSPTLLKQFAAALNLPTDYLDFLAGPVTGRSALRQLRPGQGPGCVPCLPPLAAVRRQPALRCRRRKARALAARHDWPPSSD
jgi:transcriptional regulator with XRE-family HTH domain